MKKIIIGFFIIAVVVLGGVVAYSMTSAPLTEFSIETDPRNCGSMGALTFEGTIDFETHFDANAQAVWTCMTEALEVCAPAYAMIDTSRYTIEKKEGDTCYVSGPSYDLSSENSAPQNATCGLSSRFIQLSYAHVERILPNLAHAKAFQTLSVITSKGGTLTFPDGTTETILCE